MGENVISGVILGICAIIMIGIGIFQLKSKKPVGFYNGEKEPNEDEIIDVKVWNQKHGMMWVLYGIIIMLVWICGCIIGDTMFILILYFIGMLSPLIGMIIYHHQLTKTYRGKNIFENKYAKIEYFKKYNIVLHIWKRECHHEDYRTAVEHSLKMLGKHKNSVFVADARNGFEDTKDDIEWGFQYLLPALKETGCRKWIFIVNEISDIEAEIDLWTLEIQKYLETEKVTSLKEAIHSALQA